MAATRNYFGMGCHYLLSIVNYYTVSCISCSLPFIQCASILFSGHPSNPYNLSADKLITMCSNGSEYKIKDIHAHILTE